jgi:Nuclease-related domain
VGSDVDREPAAYANARARVHNRWVIALFAAAIALLAFVLYAGLSLGSTILVLLAVAVMFAVRRRFDGQLELARRWTLGARAEAAVGLKLNELRARGFAVMHDIPQEREGNVDHLVCGPTGVFLIETKSGRYQPSHLRKAKRQAAKLHDDLGGWVTPVICRPGRKIFQHAGVWIVPPASLVAWIEHQRNAACDPQRLAAFVDSVV